MVTEINDKDIRLTDKTAIRLAKERAVREGRSAANAAARTIIEALSIADNIVESDKNQ